MVTVEVVPWAAVSKEDCHTADVSFDVDPRGVCAVNQWDVADLLLHLSLSPVGKHPPWSSHTAAHFHLMLCCIHRPESTTPA